MPLQLTGFMMAGPDTNHVTLWAGVDRSTGIGEAELG
jgi:hypothetical protein